MQKYSFGNSCGDEYNCGKPCNPDGEFYKAKPVDDIIATKDAEIQRLQDSLYILAHFDPKDHPYPFEEVKHIAREALKHIEPVKGVE